MSEFARLGAGEGVGGEPEAIVGTTAGRTADALSRADAQEAAT